LLRTIKRKGRYSRVDPEPNGGTGLPLFEFGYRLYNSPTPDLPGEAGQGYDGRAGEDRNRSRVFMPNTTLRELTRRLSLVEQEVVGLRLRQGVSPSAERRASHQVDLDTDLDRFFEAMGIQGELSGLAHLRVLQAEQEQLWAQRQQNGTAPAARSQRRKKKRGRGG